MSDKRILIVDQDTLTRMDENRGDMSRSEFVEFLINSQLGEDQSAIAVHPNYVTREEFQEFTQSMKDLLKRFLDFFISYGLELGQEPKDGTFSELVQKLQSLSAGGGKPKTTK